MNKELSWEPFKVEENDDPEFIQGIVLSQHMSQTINNYEDYNLYIGHTNFYINGNIVNLLCGTKGIESVDILSPYRFRISIGKLFQPNEILNHIKEQLIKE